MRRRRARIAAVLAPLVAIAWWPPVGAGELPGPAPAPTPAPAPAPAPTPAPTPAPPAVPPVPPAPPPAAAAAMVVEAAAIPPPSGEAALADPLVAAASPDAATRVHAVPALAASGTPQARAVLVALLRTDAAPEVRRAAAGALGASRDPGVIAALDGATRADPDAGVRQAARDARDRLRAWGRSPRRAALYSALLPGGGYLYLRRPGTAALHLGASVGLMGGGLALLGDADATGLTTGEPAAEPDDPIGVQLLMAGQNAWFYGVFAAYQDARLARRDDEVRRIPVARDTLGSLLTAPFRPSVLRRAWVWGGVPVGVGAALGLSYAVAPGSFASDRTLLDGGDVNVLGRAFDPAAGFALGEAYYGALFVPVAVGEEAVFRGVLQTELAESLGPWTGWAVASALFGGVHLLNFTAPGASMEDARWAVPYITLTGSYLGLAYMRTGYQLETSVAIHFWYDFLLSTAAFVADPDHQPFVVRIELPL